ncbi:MAG: hypothetical protein WAO98_00930 [Alphaproteobacteria bacterium]
MSETVSISTPQLLELMAKRDGLLKVINTSTPKHAVQGYMKAKFRNWDSDRYVNWQQIQNPKIPRNMPEALLMKLKPIERAFKGVALTVGCIAGPMVLATALGAACGLVPAAIVASPFIVLGAVSLDGGLGFAGTCSAIGAMFGVLAGRNVANRIVGKETDLFWTSQPSAQGAYDKIFAPTMKLMGLDPKTPIIEVTKNGAFYAHAKTFVEKELQKLDIEDLEFIVDEIKTSRKKESDAKISQQIDGGPHRPTRRRQEPKGEGLAA